MTPVVVSARQQPNILLVLSDDHSAPHLGCYQNPNARTPHLDRFALQGMRFTRAYTSAPQCQPSRSSIFTGRSPVAIQMTRFTAPLPRTVPTFLESLRRSGYYTGLGRRYHHLDGRARPTGVDQRVQEEHDLRSMRDRVDFLNVSGDKSLSGLTSSVVNQFLESRPAGKPFFLYIGFNDPHRSWRLSERDWRPDPRGLRLPPHYPDTPALREDLANYYGVLHRMDKEFSQLLGVLDERDLSENTVVFFMGDNGASLLNGKGTLYEAGCRVPLIVRWPGQVHAGAVKDQLISGEDLAPTILEIAGIRPPKQMTGRSFLGLLRDEDYEPREAVFTERGAHGQGLPVHSAAFDLGRAVTTPRFKLIYNALWQIPYAPVDFMSNAVWQDLKQRHEEGELSDLHRRLYFAPTRPMFELFDLENDPYELNNLAEEEEYATTLRELKARLAEWMILERDFLPLPTAGE